jgi:N-acyl-D-aspartate/D-glutamate deacylase
VKKTFFNTDKSNQTIVSGDHFNKETEITLDNYLEIAEKVPSRQEEIADFLAQNHAFKKLEEYEEKYPTEIGAFELAFNHQEWEKVVKADVSHLTDERKMMLAIAFLELGNKKEAELINKQIQSKTLSKKIAIAYLQDQDINAAKEIQKQLRDKNLEELIDTAAIYKEMVDYYKAEKDTTNQEIWERKFKNLGIEESESS